MRELMRDGRVHHVFRHFRVSKDPVNENPARPSLVEDGAVAISRGAPEIDLNGISGRSLVVVGVPEVHETRFQPGVVAQDGRGHTDSFSSGEASQDGVVANPRPERAKVALAPSGGEGIIAEAVRPVKAIMAEKNTGFSRSRRASR